MHWGKWSSSLIYYATRRGNVDILQYFVNEKQFDINQLDANGRTPLYYAVIYECIPALKYLISQGALDALNDDMKTSLLELVFNKYCLDDTSETTFDTIACLLHNGIKLTYSDNIDKAFKNEHFGKTIIESLINSNLLSLDMDPRYYESIFNCIKDDNKLMINIIKNTLKDNIVTDMAITNLNNSTIPNSKFLCGLLIDAKKQTNLEEYFYNINHTISLKDVMDYNNSVQQNEEISYENFSSAANIMMIMPSISNKQITSTALSNKYIPAEIFSYFLPRAFLQLKSKEYNNKTKFHEYMQHYCSKKHAIQYVWDEYITQKKLVQEEYNQKLTTINEEHKKQLLIIGDHETQLSNALESRKVQITNARKECTEQKKLAIQKYKIELTHAQEEYVNEEVSVVSSQDNNTNTNFIAINNAYETQYVDESKEEYKEVEYIGDNQSEDHSF
jgi:hypothetical protein